MANILIKKLPTDIIDVIKLYTGEGCWQLGKFININPIPKDDCRYAMLSKRPMIKQVYNDNKHHPMKGSVWFKLYNGKFVVINVLNSHMWDETQYVYGYFWEMYYNNTQTFMKLV